uniref:Folate receptor-like domain-containing protein n=1 Tax=Branchiostoma floridae TaxID=7739 RepID=C3Y1A9_BRAFL|eukprot:XP_002609639.1 hypothetical protein BRAFLDRAFT_123559 [Branchiostoma floridae]
MASLLHLLAVLSVLGCSFADHPGHVDYPGGLQTGCLQGEKHKDAPSPESGLGVCKDYSDSSCCSADIGQQLSVTPIVKVDGFRWDNCGTLSKRCQDFMVNVECFYRCSPSLPTWAAPYPSAVRGVPVCMQFCDDWMEACREDMTCADNWITGWKIEDGELNKCRSEERCRTFAQVFRNGRGLCESIWGQSFTYESTPDTPCLDFRFPPTEGQITVPEPGTESVEPAFKRQDECIIDAVDFHKKKPSPEPKLNACRNYRQDSCCTTEIDNDMVNRPIRKVGQMNWDTCGPLSPRCEEFLIDSECFYQCSPLLNKWRVPGVDPAADPFTPVVEGIPLCSHFCDGMFNACKFDRTCAVNWATDWDFSTGENKCRPDSKCELIKDVFKNAKAMCESVWGSAFTYVSNRNAPCLDPTAHPSEQVTKPRKVAVAAAESEDKWGCLGGRTNKRTPGPEPDLQVCSEYSMNSCCSAEFDQQLRMSPVVKIDKFYMNRCGTMSPRCEQFGLAMNCHYHCDPMIYRYGKRGHPWAVQNIPICSSFCDDFFDACRDDLTCAESQATDWYYSPEGINNCRPDSKCRTFAEVYVDGRGLCNNIWGDSYVYTEDDDTCINIMSIGSQTRASDAEEHNPHADHHHDDGHGHSDMSHADSDSWACVRHDDPHHKMYGDAQTLCETFFGSEFQYNSTDRCVDIPLHSSPAQDQAHHASHDRADHDHHEHEGHHSSEEGHSHDTHHSGHSPDSHGDHGDDEHHHGDDEHHHGHDEHHHGHDEHHHGHDEHHHGHDEHRHGDTVDHGHETHHGDNDPAAHGEHDHRSHHHGSRDDVRSVQPLSWPVHQCVWQTGLKDHDGLVKTCSFQKRHYSSVLRLAYSGGLILANCTECCKRWYFTINGIECQKPGGIDAIVMKMGHQGNMVHQHQQFEGFCDKVGAGVLDVELRVQDCTEHMPHHGHSGAMDPGDAQTGGHCFSRIMVFKNAKAMCESVWGSAFTYVSNRNAPCLDPTAHPTEQVTKPRKAVVAAAESEDKWGCLGDRKHKRTPGPEPDLQVCSEYSMNSCCSAEFDQQLRMSPVVKIDQFYMNRCGTMSPRCEQFRLAMNCHYHCDPMIYRYGKRGHPWAVQNIPICSSFCDDFFDACRDDLTCAESQATDWYYSPEGINNCRPDSKCRTFAEVYVDGRGLCNNIWSDSYVYTEDDDTCINIMSIGSQTRASDAEEHNPHADHHHDDGHGHSDMSQADSDSWACVRHDDPHHKEYPTPEPDLQVCSPYAYGSCCTVEHDHHLAVRPVPGVHNFSWNRCGTLSPQCENFMIDLECFNSCSPDIRRLSIPTDSGSAIPVCASFCDRWFSACRNDVTCVANWRSDWDMDDNNRNNCPEGSSCKTFDEMYGDAQTLCETFFGSEFQYNSTDKCVDIPLHSSPAQDQAHHASHDHADHDHHEHEGHHSSEEGHSHETHHPGHSPDSHGDHGHDEHHHGHDEHHHGHDEHHHGHDEHHHGHDEHHHGDHGHETHHDDDPAAHGEHDHGSHHRGSRDDVRSVQPLSWPVHQCVWQTGLKDHGGLVKTCSFQKRHYSSVLRLAYSGGLILANCTECCKRWYFTINGIECQKPGGIDAIVMKMGHQGNMVHQHQQFEGFCDKVGAGVLDVELRVQDCTEHMPHHGHSGAMDPGDAQTGGHCFSRIMVEEVGMSP